MTRQFELVEEKFRKAEQAKLPLRGTKTSAGYDFYATEDLVIKPQEKAFFWSDVRAKMENDEVLLGFVRSSMGIKKDLTLANTVAVIDSDYYNEEKTGGNIGICIRNTKPSLAIRGTLTMQVGNGEIKIPNVVDLTEENTITIKAGERVAQFIFVKYQESANCNSEVERKGGIGSTSEI